MLGMLRQAQALESRAAAVKLGILRALIRDDDQPLPGGGYHGDLPEGWTSPSPTRSPWHCRMPAVSADKMMWAAWDLQARLPGTGAPARGRGPDLRQGQGRPRGVPAAQRRGRGQRRGDDPRRSCPARPTGRSSSSPSRPRSPSTRSRRPAAARTPSGTSAGWRCSARTPARPPCPAATCPPTRPWPPMPTSAPAPSNTRTPARSPPTPAWTSSAPRPTSTC